MTWLFRALVMVATTYLTLLVILWSFQSHFIYPSPQDVPSLTPGYEEVSLRTSDGLTLRAFYREAEPGMPTTVYFHGNGGTLEMASTSNIGFANAGFGVLLVEYRGYGGNPGQPSEEGFYRDGEAAMDWLVGEGLPLEQVVFVGNSIGSGVATEMAVRHRPAALVLIAPFTSLPEVAGNNLWWMPAHSLVNDQYRNAEKIAELQIPVLIQHGDADALIPHEHGKRLSRIAPDATFQSFAGSGHGLTFEPRSQEARRDWILDLVGAD